MVESYLRGRQQYVVHNSIASDQLPTSHGIPQGSIMGLTLFLLYVNDLFNCLLEGSVIAYTDDVTLIANGETAKIALSALQSLLNIICLWSADNCLHFNPIKCSLVAIAPSKQKAAAISITPICKLLVNGRAIIRASSIKIISVIFTSELRQQE